MTRKAFFTLLAVTAVAVAAAAFAVAFDRRPVAPDLAGEPVLPGLVARLNDVAKIVVEGSGTTLTIERGADGWRLVERAGYPVDRERARGLLVALARLERLEPKTRRPELYERLELRDPEVEGARSRRVSLLDGEGKTIAALIVGKSKFSLSGDGGVYVRLPDDPQTWLARGELDLGTEPRDWLARTIADIPSKRVRRVVVRHPDGETVEVSKASPEESDFALAGLPDGAKVKSQFDVNGFASVLSGLDLDDVKPAGEVTFPPDDTLEAEIETFEGLVLELALAEIDGDRWLRLAVRRRPAADGDEDAAREAAALAERVDGWVYKVPAYKFTSFVKRRDELVETAPAGS